MVAGATNLVRKYHHSACAMSGHIFFCLPHKNCKAPALYGQTYARHVLWHVMSAMMIVVVTCLLVRGHAVPHPRRTPANCNNPTLTKLAFSLRVRHQQCCRGGPCLFLHLIWCCGNRSIRTRGNVAICLFDDVMGYISVRVVLQVAWVTHVWPGRVGGV